MGGRDRETGMKVGEMDRAGERKKSSKVRNNSDREKATDGSNCKRQGVGRLVVVSFFAWWFFPSGLVKSSTKKRD